MEKLLSFCCFKATLAYGAAVSRKEILGERVRRMVSSVAGGSGKIMPLSVAALETTCVVDALFRGVDESGERLGRELSASRVT
jgi:hypothetical protein